MTNLSGAARGAILDSYSFCSIGEKIAALEEKLSKVLTPVSPPNCLCYVKTTKTDSMLNPHRDYVQIGDFSKRCCFAADTVELIISRLETESLSPWGASTLATLCKMSPLSVKLTFEQLKRGRSQVLHPRSLAPSTFFLGYSFGSNYNIQIAHH